MGRSSRLSRIRGASRVGSPERTKNVTTRLAVSAVLLGLCLAGSACTKAREDAAPVASEAAAPISSGTATRETSVAPAPRARAAPLRNEAGKLTVAGFSAAWNETYMAVGSESEPASKKLAIFEAKVGRPARVDGDDRVWFAFDGEACHRIALSSGGTKSDVEITPRSSIAFPDAVDGCRH